MLKINDLNVKIGEKHILNNLSVDFENGAITCILGANGCGKTTLLRSIDGLTKCSGSIIFNEKDVKNMSIKERAKVIAFLPQKRPTPKIEGGLLIEHGRFPHLNFMKTLDEKDIEIVNKAIEMTSTENLINKLLTKMSGGEQQRVYIACALAQETDILLLDEPTTHLDLQSQIDILNLMKKLKETGKTIIVVLHDIVQAFSISDKIILMKDGEIIDYGSPEDVCQNGKVKDVFGFDIERDDSQNALYPFKLTNIKNELE